MMSSSKVNFSDNYSKKKITILIPLLDRENFTKDWLEKNIIKDYDYFFPDGSKENGNQKLFDEINKDNIRYSRFPYDKTPLDYLKKMSDTASKIKTDYVMTSDNDDFLNFNGINRCIEFLDKNKDYICASGAIFFINKQNDDHSINEKKFCISPRYLDGVINLSDRDTKDGVLNYLNAKKSSYLWYAVYRSDYFKRIWYDLEKTKISDFSLIELLQTCFSLKYGLYKFLGLNHYIRLENTSNNAAKMYKTKFSERLKNEKQVSEDYKKFLNIILYNFNLSNEELELIKNRFEKKRFSSKNRFRFIFFKIFSKILNIKSYKLSAIIYIIDIYAKLKFFMAR